MTKIPNKETLDVITKKLAEILRIQDWDIDIHIVSGFEMANINDGDSKTHGLSCRDTRLNKADVYLNSDNIDDWYVTLVHELIHVQTTLLVATANAYFEEPHSYFTNIYEGMVEKQAVIFCKIYPIVNFDYILRGETN